MATYCISDIHGSLKEFESLLDKIDFKYDGTDQLIIMGDMVDWGKQSIETLLLCKDLDELGVAKVLMGNHEHMMLEELKKGVRRPNPYFKMTVWYANGGLVTLKGFAKLPRKEQREVEDWLEQLDYYVDNLELGGRKFYVTHSMPYTDLCETDEYDYKDEYEKMIWERPGMHDNPMKDILGDTETILVYGHTITTNYGCVVDDEVKVYMDLDNQKINIDCGAKMLSRGNFGNLAALRLDDLEVFYVGRIDE